MPLTQLPDSILLCIIFESDIATLKHLRLACRNFNALIEAYGKSIHATALARAYTQDLVDSFDIRWRERNHLTALFITDGRIQEARWMAAVRLRAASQIWPPDQYHDPTTNIMPMWECVVMGLGIMWRLHDCATQEMCLDFGHDALHSAAYMSDITIDYPQLEDFEKRILHKQIPVVENLTLAHRRSLYYALGYCVRVLYQGRAFTPELDIRAKVNEYWKDQWIKWLVLREGPTFIATAWRSEAVKRMHSELIERALTNRNPAQIDIEIAAVKLLYEAVKQEGILSREGGCPSPYGQPLLVASEREVAELEPWCAGQGLAGTNWHLALGRQDFTIVYVRDHS
ncbi:hypothetical protein CC80DRAFT_498397 [Byssothecium circinans]|uniref:F-box domain-containing protein n=1 Tax=Byssothecium circinans TaxID=147558 RepID=A0A6A5TBL9_9PLEO|nr:hypothetical protein CC80DRAFT_498397 [Byssothecium circinans]